MGEITSGDLTTRDGLFGYCPDEIEEMVLSHAEYVLDGFDYDIIAIRVFGSRMTDDLYRNDSDVDVLFIYDGDVRDDYMFDLFAEDPLYVEGAMVDVFPERDRTLEEMMKKDREHQEEKRVP